MSQRPRSDDDEAHDILAAEAFEVPAADPALHVEPPHDVLAAEEFEMPAPDPELRHVPVPADPSGTPEPHDVLAADEFPMPAVRGHGPALDAAGPRPRRLLVLAGGGIVGVLALRALRRH